MRYIHTSEIHNLKAPTEIVPYIFDLFKPQSVVDVGCGLGTFLHVFKQQGVNRVIGIDGSWVNLADLYIDKSEFIQIDLESKFNLEQQFDLVLSLEVIEHLSYESAKTAINNLVSLGKVIIFSAAIPYQGGQNHLNEKEFKFWQKCFLDHGYHFYDAFRSHFWNNNMIDWWYRQNMFLVVHESISLAENVEKTKISGDVGIYVHPELYNAKSLLLTDILSKYNDVLNGNANLSTYIKALLKKVLSILK